MSDLTKFVRSIPGGGAVLDTIESVESDAGATVAAAAAPVAAVAVKDVGSAVGTAVSALLTKHLGSAATIPEDVVNFALQEVENWVLSKL